MNVPGRPLQYRTTPDFLRTFGLASLEELPELELAELGTHDELMQNNGLYREMWDAQSEWLNGSGSERCA